MAWSHPGREGEGIRLEYNDADTCADTCADTHADTYADTYADTCAIAILMTSPHYILQVHDAGSIAAFALLPGNNSDGKDGKDCVRAKFQHKEHDGLVQLVYVAAPPSPHLLLSSSS